MVERFGRFQSVKGSGLHFKIPFFDRIAGRVSLKIQQLDVAVETKTKDDVFVKLRVSVQYRILSEQIYDAFYKLENSKLEELIVTDSIPSKPSSKIRVLSCADLFAEVMHSVHHNKSISSQFIM